MMTNWNHIDTVAKKWIFEAGKDIIASFEGALTIQAKSSPNDLVTNIDQQTEQFFAERIRSEFPDHKILGEEGLGDELDHLGGIVWIIDPIDGTMNFIHQQRNFMISIGIFENGENRLGYLYDVVHRELYHARKGGGAFWDQLQLPQLDEPQLEQSIGGLNPSWLVTYPKAQETLYPLVKKIRGTRSYGSAALEIAYVATGRLDFYLSLNLSPWDFAGGKVIIEELGGVVSDLHGNSPSLLRNGPILISKPGIHGKIVKDYFAPYIK